MGIQKFLTAILRVRVPCIKRDDDNLECLSKVKVSFLQGSSKKRGECQNRYNCVGQSLNYAFYDQYNKQFKSENIVGIVHYSQAQKLVIN